MSANVSRGLLPLGHDSILIYYDQLNPVNAYLGAQTFALDGGGFLIPVPEPSSLWLLAGSAPWLLPLRTRSQN